MFEPVLQSESIALRLWHEFSFSVQEFRNNPSGFLRETFRDERQKDSKRTLLLAATFTLFFYSIFLALILILGVSKVIPQTGKTEEVVMIDPGKPPLLPISSNHGGTGGNDAGGGQKAPTPVSNGQVPRTSTVPPIVAPDPRRTPTAPPTMPVADTIQSPTNTVQTQIPNMQVGLPTAPPGLPPSPGSGSGGGIGNGQGPGAGNGNGPGANPNGRPGNGSGPGINGPGGALGNNPNGPKNGSGAPNSKARVYYMPEPHYTPDALKNKIVGTVVVFIRANADGTVSNPRVLSPLGYGLDEEAIRVALLVKFYPKIENGRPVNDTMSLTITFRGK